MPKKTVKSNVASREKKKKPARVKHPPNSFEVLLREAVSLADVADSLTAPLMRSIQNLLRLAARSVNSEEASVLVRDGQRGGLRFIAAIGKVADKLLKVRLPPGKGVAGFVFSSGQPMAVADTSLEESFYAQVDHTTGYRTQILLATPLRANGEIIGVLEFVNRTGDPPYAAFTPDEMDRAAHFADAIATLVDAHQSSSLIETLFTRVLSDPEKSFSKDIAERNAALRSWLKHVRGAPEHRDLLRMAVSLREIAARGDAERELCRDIIDALARWTMRANSTNMGYLNF